MCKIMNTYLYILLCINLCNYMYTVVCLLFLQVRHILSSIPLFNSDFVFPKTSAEKKSIQITKIIYFEPPTNTG